MAALCKPVPSNMLPLQRQTPLSDVLKWKRCTREGSVGRMKATLLLFKCSVAERDESDTVSASDSVAFLVHLNFAWVVSPFLSRSHTLAQNFKISGWGSCRRWHALRMKLSNKCIFGFSVKVCVVLSHCGMLYILGMIRFT